MIIVEAWQDPHIRCKQSRRHFLEAPAPSFGSKQPCECVGISPAQISSVGEETSVKTILPRCPPALNQGIVTILCTLPTKLSLGPVFALPSSKKYPSLPSVPHSSWLQNTLSSGTLS